MRVLSLLSLLALVAVSLVSGQDTSSPAASSPATSLQLLVEDLRQQLAFGSSLSENFVKVLKVITGLDSGTTTPEQFKATSDEYDLFLSGFIDSLNVVKQAVESSQKELSS